MKFQNNQPTAASSRARLCPEAQLCFGAAVGCLSLGLVGFAINALTSAETTMSAFLVIGMFYLVLGTIKLRTSQPAYAAKNGVMVVSKRKGNIRDQNRDDEFVESAA